MLLRHIERFLRNTDMPSARFGRLAASDPRFVYDLRNGRIPRERMEARVERFMNEYLSGERTSDREHGHAR